MRFAIFAVSMLTFAACDEDAPPTPEAVIAQMGDGAIVTVQGTVFATTFNNRMDADDQFPLDASRYVLVRTKIPDRITLGDLDPTRVGEAFGLGLHVTSDQLANRTFTFPQAGDVVRATGTFRRVAWRDTQVPALEDLTELRIIKAAAPAPLGPGDACNVDMDCADDLICARATHTCGPTPMPIVWDSEWHDVNGACRTDDDCPVGQTCDARYTIPSTGNYRADYHAATDDGRHICVLMDPSPDAACPRIGSTIDLAGGRYVQGKEVCIRGIVLGPVGADDRDTHDQLKVREPLPFPFASIRYEFFGAVSENSPPYKDPSRPAGALADPTADADITLVGTYRYDNGHGWFEIHPFKAWWPSM